jgi:hypothetical protein
MEGKKIRIYIAGPYSAPTHWEREANTQRAIEIAVILMLKGHEPYVPHLTHYVDLAALDMDISFTYDRYMQLGKEWLQQCDALFYLSSSPGADMELGWAIEMGLQVFRHISEVPLDGVVVAESPPIDG